jgi:hypothetical protein
LRDALPELLALFCKGLRLLTYELAVKLDQLLRFPHANGFPCEVEHIRERFSRK